MASLEPSFTEKYGQYLGKGTTLTALGSFILYLLGYLTLRFQLSTHGVATNLDLFDEKYLFAGCRFLVYLLSSIPIVFLLAFIFLGLGVVPYRMMAASARQRFIRLAQDWLAQPLRLAFLGTVGATLFIQFVLRKCFSLGNLLLAKQLPYKWITLVLLSSDGLQSLYFSALVAGTLITASIFYVTLRHRQSNPARLFLVYILGFLVIVEFLFLPVNYGVLISTQRLPRLVPLNVGAKATPEETQWLVWETKDALTFFTRTPDDRRMLVTVPRKDSEIRIAGYDDIYCVLFSSDHGNSRPCQR